MSSSVAKSDNLRIMKLRLFYLLTTALLFFACGKPVASFTFAGDNDGKLVAPATVFFENTSLKADGYTWDFGDGQTATTASPNHTYRSSGNYSVKLTAEKGRKKSVVEQRLQVTAPLDCLVEIETDFGNMIVRLSDATPRHRDNFIKLAEEGYYDGLLFHRVIEGFMIQGGDPTSRNARAGQTLGMGGPAYTVPAEFVDSLVHLKGALAAARLGDQANPEKESSGSQFYIVQGRPLAQDDLDAMEARKGIRYTKGQKEKYLKMGGSPQLDREYTVFGQVIKGLEVIDKIAASETGPGDRPMVDVRMKIRVVK